ncbi:hypothetical protein H5410_041525 [Solanum commersonii]|uniref:Uncharacterized protein n=1 Tax=Solanum commersonii TaxID=4109 RepID=A0A9J5XRT9_SOLCO|nr:hypothetical protein H5410_041525 [Solanum commersonii]
MKVVEMKILRWMCGHIKRALLLRMKISGMDRRQHMKNEVEMVQTYPKEDTYDSLNAEMVCIIAKIAMVLYLPKKESAITPPSKHKRNEVPMKSETILAEVALGRCIVPIKQVTRFTAMPIVDSLSLTSIPGN